MNLTSAPAFQKLFGLFELDADGTIVHSRSAATAAAFGFGEAVGATLVGRNFFDEIAPFKNVEEFRRRFRYFMKGSSATENFVFDCRFDDDAVVPVKVKLAHICEREFAERTRLVIVDIRKI